MSPNTTQTAEPAAQLTIDQILAIRSLAGSEAPQWTPNGSAITFVTGLGGGAELWNIAPQGGPPTRLTVGMGGVGHLATFIPRWSPTGEYIAYVSTKSGADEVWLWPADGSPDFQLTGLGARVEAMSWSPDGRSLAVASNMYGSFDIFRIDVPSGKTTRLTDGPLNAVYPTFTPDGTGILYVQLNASWVDHDVTLIELDGSNPRVVLQDHDFFDYHYGRSFGYPTVSPDGTSFLFHSQRSGWTSVWSAPLDGSSDARQIAVAEADQGDPAWSPDGSQIVFTENHNGTVMVKVVDAAGGAARTLVDPGVGVCSGPSWSPDGSQVSYLLGTPLCPNDLWVVDVKSGEQRRLTHSMLGGGVENRLVQPEKLTYRTFDDRDINAYLYRPAGQLAAKSCPAIMWIHGGPTSQYMDTFQPQVQYFVQQGYVVLMPNPRGSSGYGRAFEDLNNRDWGGGDLQDVVAGANFLKTLSEVDSEHIGITGTSYGGIMTMNAVAFAPNVFQAAVASSGYCDFVNMHGEQELRHIKLLEFELGTLPENEDVYRKCSAIYQVHQATTPCFVLHGEGKYPGSSEGRLFALTLEANYKPFWYKTYPGETYYVASPANVRRMLLDMQAFFDLYLKGTPHSLPDDGTRPLTHLSGIAGASGAASSRRASSSAFVSTPGRDVAT